MEKLRIVFMGTPSFAVGILDAILKKGYTIVGVITAADKPAGRGQKIKFSDVKQYAIDNNLPILQPTNLKDENFIEELKSLNANLQVVVAFRMLPEVVWKMPKLGTFNLHASLLPNYRGAAPINWAIINGETKTGVTTFFIDDKIDTGAIILIDETNIDEKDTFETLHDKLMALGITTVLNTLKLIETGSVKTKIQPENKDLKTAYKLNKENCRIDFNQKGINVYNLIRGLSPYPCAYCFLKDNENDWNIKIYEAHFIAEKHSLLIGEIITTKKELKIAVSDGFIDVVLLQFPGKKKMTTVELLNGIRFSSDAKAY